MPSQATVIMHMGSLLLMARHTCVDRNVPGQTCWMKFMSMCRVLAEVLCPSGAGQMQGG